MVLTHRERISPKKSQAELVEEKVKTGARLTPLPTPASTRAQRGRRPGAAAGRLDRRGLGQQDAVRAGPIRDAVGLMTVTHKTLESLTVPSFPRQGEAPAAESTDSTENGGAAS